MYRTREWNEYVCACLSITIWMKTVNTQPYIYKNCIVWTLLVSSIQLSFKWIRMHVLHRAANEQSGTIASLYWYDLIKLLRNSYRHTHTDVHSVCSRSTSCIYSWVRLHYQLWFWRFESHDYYLNFSSINIFILRLDNRIFIYLFISRNIGGVFVKFVTASNKWAVVEVEFLLTLIISRTFIICYHIVQ